MKSGFYNSDGDQLCSNTAIVFGFFALILGIVPQSTCSFLSVNPDAVLQLPGDWGNQSGIGDGLNITINTENTTGGDDTDDARGRRRQLRSSSWLDLLENGRNITATSLTLNVGPWKFGSNQIDGMCYKIDDYKLVPVGVYHTVSRITGVVASVLGFFALSAACVTCGVDDKERRKRNRLIAGLYTLAALSTCMTFLLFSGDECHGAIHTWRDGLLDGLIVRYAGCQCRAGCFITIAVACCYLIAAGTVLI